MKKKSMIRLSVVILMSVGAISVASQQAYAQTDRQHAQTQPVAMDQVAALQRAGADEQQGAAPGSADAVGHLQNGSSDRGDSNAKCVGPVSFCTVFFGS